MDESNYEGSKAIEIASSNLVLVSKVDCILMYDNVFYTPCGEIPITLLSSDTREPNQIIGMQKSSDENLLAIISGKNLVMD